MNIFKIVKTNEKVFNNGLIFLLIFYPFIFIWQCGDLTDTGYMAYIFENFFENLKIGKVFSPVFLTDLIGATWFEIFPDFGIIGLKFLYLLFLYPIIFIIYLILKRVIENKTLILFSVFCGIVFSERCFNFVYTKDISCWFFLIISGFLLIKGVEEKKYKPIFFSGIFLSLAILCRIPSMIAIILIPLMLTYKIFYKEEKNLNHQFKFLFKNCYYLFIGFILCLLIFLLILNFLNLLNVFSDNFKSLNELSKSSHSPFLLIKKIFKEFVIFIPYSIFVITFLIFSSVVYKYLLKQKKIINFFLYIFLALFLVIIIDHDFTYNNKIMYIVPAFCLLPLLYSLINKDKFSLTVLVCLAFTFAQVFGTNTGFFLKLLYGFMVLLPLSIVILSSYNELVFRRLSFLTLPFSISGIMIILFISFTIRILWIYHVDYGLKSRFRAIYTIDNPKMAGVLTTKKNAKHIEDLYFAIKNCGNQNNSLFIYGHQPMFYYLTNKKPVLENFWLSDKMHQPQELFLKINENIFKTKKWPIIVDTKGNVLGNDGELALQKFLISNNYICKIDKPDFNIWVKN